MSLRSADVVVGLLTENTPRMLTQATRLLRSIRWFGGELAHARIVACSVGELESCARKTLEQLGAEIRVVSRFHPANPTANRLQLIAELLDAPERVLFVLDCDTIVVQDPLPLLDADVFQGKIAPTPTVSDDVFERLFAHFQLPMPPRAHITPFDGTPTIPYFNAGVLAIPTALARKLEASWRKYNRILADDPDLVAPCQRHMHQASLALALAEAGTPVRDLPHAMNYQINATHVAAPAGYAGIDPVIIHYHHLGTDDGFLLPTPYPGAQARIDAFHERMRKEGFVPDQRAHNLQPSQPIVVLGMHRSGTSLVTELVAAMGSYAGPPDKLTPPDIFNPNGYWEHIDVGQITRDVLKTFGANWTNVARVAISALSPDQHTDFVARAKEVARSLSGRESFVMKEPRMSLIFPLWAEALENPICVIAWRDPLAVARSLKHRDKRPFLGSLALWEHYNRVLLRDTDGLPRVLVAYDELLADPLRVVRDLHGALTRFGATQLKKLSEDRIRQSVNADFNRSGKNGADESLLDAEQHALLDDLRSGAALEKPVTPTSPRKLELLAEYAAFDRAQNEAHHERVSLHREVAELDLLLRGVFESRSWRVGRRIIGLFKLLRRKNEPSAEERWTERTAKRR
jgi:hypothetical protein